MTIAIVAIHGVPDQKPADSARAVANLLVSLGPERYSEFDETRISIKRRPVETEGRSAPASNVTGLNERSAMLQQQQRTGVAPPDFGDLFMTSQLECYTGDEAGSVYETVRLEGQRTVGDRTTNVHVHEVYNASGSLADSSVTGASSSWRIAREA